MQLEPRETELLLDAARRLAAVRTLAEVAQVTCTEVRRLTGADGAELIMRDAGHADHVDEDAIAPLWKGQRFALDACLAGRAMLHRESIAITGEPPVPSGTFVKSLAMVPVCRDEPLAAIGVYWARTGGPSARAIAAVETLATFTAAALENAAAFAAKDELFGLLGHALRDPLSPIVTALNLIQLRGRDPYEHEHGIIDRQVTRVVRLVDDLLDMSRIARGAIQLSCAPIELSRIVARGLALTGALIDERGVAVAVAVPETGILVDADLDRLTQVVANLLTNAAKYTPRAGRIDVIADIEGSCARLVVRDSGSGIEPALLPRVFDLHSNGRRGLGLGLAIVRSLVELHGGVVSAASEGPGRGATFTIRIPLSE